jgi:hypothetical protein
VRVAPSGVTRASVRGVLVSCRELVNSSGSGHGRVIRADTPPRRGIEPDGREVLWLLSRQGAVPIRAELVSFFDAVELEVFGGGTLRRRWRFIRDTAARNYADRLKRRLLTRKFVDRRGGDRTIAWPL